MSLNIVLATGSKTVDKYVASMTDINVLTNCKTRESVLDAVLSLNPHTLILAYSLSGKQDFEDIIIRVRKNAPGVKIVFLYGAADTEFKYFADFLVSNEVYNFLCGDIDADALDECILKDFTFEDVKSYKLADQGYKTEVETEQLVSRVLQPTEKIIQERTIIRTLKNHIQIAVAGVCARIGCTSTALAIAKLLADKGYKVALVEYNTHVYKSIHKDQEGVFSYLKMLDEMVTCRKSDLYYSTSGIDVFFSSFTRTANERKLAELKGLDYDYIVLDSGIFDSESKDFDVGEFNKSDLKIIISGVKPHENNLSDVFETCSSIISDIHFVVNFSTVKQFAQFEKEVKSQCCNLGYMPNPLEPADVLNDIVRCVLKENIIIQKKRGFSLWGKK